MGILAEVKSNQSNVSRMPNADRPQAKLWVNIGLEVNGRFVNLPVGIPLDTMEPLRVTGQNEEWKQFVTARNELMKTMQTIGDGLEPGAAAEIPGLTVQVRKVDEQTPVDTETSPYNTDLSSIMAGIIIKPKEVKEPKE